MAVSQDMDITREQRETVRSLLERHLPNTEAWAYGSRVKWTSRPASDLDIVVFAPPRQARLVGDLREAFSESHLPFRVDLFVWDEVPRSFRQQIELEHVVLVPGKSINVPDAASRPNWTQLSLGRVCTKIGSGATPRGGKDVYLPHGPYALIRSQNVLNEGFRDEGLAYIGAAHASQLKNVDVAEDDILLNITGDSVARVCQVRPDVLPARVNQHVAIVRPDPATLDPRFLRYALVSPEMQTRLLSWAGSGAPRNALTKGMIESLSVVAPQDVGEQRAIGHILGTLDDKIELNRRMNDTLEAMARALFKSWFVDFEPVLAKMDQRDPGLPQHICDLFPNALDDEQQPSGWSRQTLTALAGVNPESWSSQNIPERVDYVDLANTKWGTIETTHGFRWLDAPSRARRVLQPGDTIIGTVRPGNGSYALIAAHGLTGSTGFAVLRPRQCHHTAFVFLAATAPENIERLSHLADGAAYPAIRPDVVGSTLAAVPDDALMAAFSELASPVLDQIESNKAQNETLAQARDLLLPKLISGEIRAAQAQRAVEAVTGSANA